MIHAAVTVTRWFLSQCQVAVTSGGYKRLHCEDECRRDQGGAQHILERAVVRHHRRQRTDTLKSENLNEPAVPVMNLLNEELNKKM